MPTEGYEGKSRNSKRGGGQGKRPNRPPTRAKDRQPEPERRKTQRRKPKKEKEGNGRKKIKIKKREEKTENENEITPLVIGVDIVTAVPLLLQHLLQ